MKIAICGDWHCSYGFALSQIKELHNRGVTDIYHCGDFGYWPHTDLGEQYLKMVSDALTTRGMRLYWVDGNHENFDALEEACKHVPSAYRKKIIKPGIWYLPRATTFSVDNTNFLAMGGAFSIDKAWRTPHVSWWHQETITEGDVQRAISAITLANVEGYPIDVILAHDAPLSANLQLQNGYKDDRESEANRERLQYITDAAAPKYLFHGHYHQRLTTHDHRNVTVVGLADNRTSTRENCIYFDTETKEVIE